MSLECGGPSCGLAIAMSLGRATGIEVDHCVASLVALADSRALRKMNEVSTTSVARGPRKQMRRETKKKPSFYKALCKVVIEIHWGMLLCVCVCVICFDEVIGATGPITDSGFLAP